MLQQYIEKKRRLFRGLVNAKIRKNGKPYKSDSWWDSDWYTSGVSDRLTVSAEVSEFVARYHYSSVEQILLGYAYNKRLELAGKRVLDIGSGSGHWIDFWKGLGVGTLTGIDIARASAEFLSEKYALAPNVTVHHGRSVEVINGLSKDETNGTFDLVNAIGVMFHLVDDQEWADTIRAVGECLPKGGLFFVGGHFGSLNGLDVQMDANGDVNKRLRSLRNWRANLKLAGFESCNVFRNHAYLGIRDPLPENNILVARKG